MTTFILNFLSTRRRGRGSGGRVIHDLGGKLRPQKNYHLTFYPPGHRDRKRLLPGAAGQPVAPPKYFFAHHAFSSDILCRKIFLDNEDNFGPYSEDWSASPIDRPGPWRVRSRTSLTRISSPAMSSKRISMFLKRVCFIIAGLLLLGHTPALAEPSLRVGQNGVVYYCSSNPEPDHDGPEGSNSPPELDQVLTEPPVAEFADSPPAAPGQPSGTCSLFH